MRFLNLLVQAGLRDFPTGYAVTEVETTFMIDEDGAILSVDRESSRTAVLPHVKRSCEIRPNTGLDNPMYMWGFTSKERQRTNGEPERKRQAYREVLISVDHPAARAMERFIDANVPSVKTGQEPTFKADQERFLVEVKGHPEWWLSPEVRRRHAVLLAEELDSGETGQCSLCLAEDAPLAHKIPPARVNQRDLLLTTYGDAVGSMYGHKDASALLVPTCVSCAGAIGTGFNATAALGGTFRGIHPTLTLLWWYPEAPSAEGGPWWRFDTILHPASDPDAVATALAGVEDSAVAFLACHSFAKDRYALTRFADVPATALRDRLTRWREALEQDCWRDAPAEIPALQLIAEVLLPEGQRRAWDDTRYLEVTRILLHHLILGEALPNSLISNLRRLVLKDTKHGGITRARRASLLSLMEPTTMWTEADIVDKAQVPLLATLPENERAAFTLGRAIVEAANCQRRRSQVQRTVDKSHLSVLTRRPQDAPRFLAKYGEYVSTRNGGRKLAMDRHLSALLETTAALSLPKKLDAGQRYALDRGMAYQRSVLRSRWKALNATEPANDEETAQP